MIFFISHQKILSCLPRSAFASSAPVCYNVAVENRPPQTAEGGLSMSHSVEILSVGTELLLGNIANLDAQILSQGLSELGLNVFWHTVVGDNPQRAKEAVAIAKERADIIITTGGLGPTCDDLTKNVLAEAFGKELLFHEECAQRIRAYFQRIGREMTDNNLQQAMLPEGCTVLDNDWGTAPGCAFFAEGVHVIMLPGPPSECRPMFQYRARPYLLSLSEGVIASHTLKLFGIGESTMEAQLRDQMNAMHNPTLAPYAKEGECELRVTAKAPTDGEAQALLKPTVEQIKSLFGAKVYGVDVSSLEEAVSLAGKGLPGDMAARTDGTADPHHKGEIFIIGGGEIYRQAVPLADMMYITEVHTEVDDADTFFPRIDAGEWEEVSRSEMQIDHTCGLGYEFVTYSRKTD